MKHVRRYRSAFDMRKIRDAEENGEIWWKIWKLSQGKIEELKKGWQFAYKLRRQLVLHEISHIFQVFISSANLKLTPNWLQIATKLSHQIILNFTTKTRSNFHFPFLVVSRFSQIAYICLTSTSPRSSPESQPNTWSHSNNNLHQNFASLKPVEKVFLFCFLPSQHEKKKRKSSGGKQTDGKCSELSFLAVMKKVPKNSEVLRGKHEILIEESTEEVDGLRIKKENSENFSENSKVPLICSTLFQFVSLWVEFISIFFKIYSIDPATLQWSMIFFEFHN